MKLQVKTTASAYMFHGEYLEFDSPEMIRRQIELLQEALSERPQRLEFFDDGIYFDGKPLKLRGKHAAILRCFEVLDKVPVIDLIYKVWGNSDVKENNVSVTVSTLNRELIDYGMSIERDGEFYKILK
ncbi:MAG: hypothetical protein IJG38_01935 [Thermoguttaceae bacterium]|nr:hypothetical protein [Thermoguttaceae bacterium]